MSVGDKKKSATDRLISDDIAFCLRHNQIMRKAYDKFCLFLRNVDNG